MVWGIRSRYYNSASTAALVLGANTLTTLNGSYVTGCTGTYNGMVVENDSMPPGMWTPILSLTPSGESYLTHQGSYRVLARVQGSPSPVQLQLLS